jgi:hypothetical protein
MPSFDSAAQTEWSLLLASCSVASRPDDVDEIQRLLAETIDWVSLLDLTDRHGVMPLLCQALARIESQVPPEPMRLLKQRYQTNLHKSLILASELIRVLDCLDALELEVIPYKGVTLAECVYGNIALRQSGDIDLLVRPRDFSRIKDAVRTLGYTPHLPLSELEEQAYLSSGYECAFDCAAGRNLLELQWALQPRFYSVDYDMEHLFRRAVHASVAGRRVKTLSHEDLFLVLSMHAAKHVWARLIWLCDLAQVMTLPNLNWSWIGNQAQAMGIARIVRVSLHLVRALLGMPAPVAAESVLPDDPSVSLLASEIRTRVITGTSVHPESLAYFRLMMQLRERRIDRLRFLQRLAFTPGPGEWKAVRLPRPLFPMYRLVRLSRLAARIVRA